MPNVKELTEMTREQRALLAAKIARSKQSASAPRVPEDRRNRFEPFPLTDVQMAYLIGRSEQLELGNIGCHSYSEVTLDDCDPIRLEAALQVLIERHEMLRCTISDDGTQRILKSVPRYRLAVSDLSQLSPQEVTLHLESIRDEMSHRVYATDRWPLFEFRISQQGQGVSRLHSSIDLIIADGRSLQILFRELAQLYRDPQAQLPELELSFRDYVLAAEPKETSNTFKEARQYWLDRMASLPASPALPLAMNPNAIAQPRFVRRQTRLERSAWRSLKHVASEAGLTASGILLAAFSDVLTLWSKNTRQTINLTLFNRPPLHAQANDIIADCTSVSLLEVDSSGNEPFAIRARRLQEQLWRDIDHREFSGIRVVRELAHTQGSGPQAMMPVVFTSLLNIGDSSDNRIWAAQFGEPIWALNQTPQVYLDCIVHEHEDDLIIIWDAVESVFPPGLLDDMFGAYQQLIDQLSCENDHWERPLADAARSLLPVEQSVSRQEANNTAAPLTDELLHSGFLRQVKQRPTDPAIITPEHQLTFEEVHERAAAVEQQLRGRNVQPNTLVAVLMEKGWEQVVAVLGIHYAGAAYLPIDAQWPAERQRYLIEYGEAKVVLTQSSIRDELTVPDGVEVVDVDLLEPLNGDAPAPRQTQSVDDLAYVIFTSGSTGLPKGVMIDHRGALNTVLDVNQRFDVGPSDRVLAVSRLSFDLSVYDIFGVLGAGGAIVMPSAELALNPAHWARLVADKNVTIWNTVPALMQLLVEQASGQDDALGQTLRVVMMSGDWIPLGLPDEICRLLPRAQIISMGGATEASIWSILFPIDQVDPKWKSIPYGKPMLNQSFHVFNDVLGPCPVWVPGQLYIGGIGVAKGYWRDPEKTSASFIRHPTTGEQLYRTGDLGRYLPDGNIEFLGREDSQVKVQGHRIELGEIETHLQEHEAVEDCAVVVREDVPGERRLVAYIVGKEASRLEQNDWRAFLRTHLPEYMVPATFSVLETFPLTSNGKVDRNSLPAPTIDDRPTTSDKASPRDALEQQLTGVWEKILQIHPIGLTDNFFDLGGHSFLAVRLFSEIERLTGRQLGLATLLEAPTVEQLAQVLRSKGWSPNWSSLVPIHPGGNRPPFYCVHGAGGNVLMYHALSRRLGPDYPVYGLQSQGLDGTSELVQDVHQMAEHYVREIRELQPQGPYYLGGFCMGGLVALEMAQQLRAKGDEVGLLVMFETYVLSALKPLTAWERMRYYVQKIEFHARNYGRLSFAQQWRFLVEKLKVVGERKEVWLGQLASKLRGTSHGAEHQDGYKQSRASLLAKLWDANDAAAMNYSPSPYDGVITEFRPDREYAFLDAADIGSSRIALRGLKSHKMPVCPAGMMIEPFVEHTAETLRRCIDASVSTSTTGMEIRDTK